MHAKRCSFAAGLVGAMAVIVNIAPGVTADHPLALVQSIYRLPDPDFQAFYDKQRRLKYYTPRILALMAKKEACYLKKYKMNDLDLNYIILGQDYDIRRLALALLKEDGAAAIVRVEYSGPQTKGRLDYYLKRGANGWRVDDVSIGAHDTLSRALTGPC